MLDCANRRQPTLGLELRELGPCAAGVTKLRAARTAATCLLLKSSEQCRERIGVFPNFFLTLLLLLLLPSLLPLTSLVLALPW